MKGKSGAKLWTARVQKNYASLAECRYYNRVYGIAKRLGFRSAKALWEANPVIGGSSNPIDLCIVRK